MEGLSYGTQTAGMPCFGQFNGDSEFWKAMEVVDSCSSSVRMFRKCTKFLLKLVCAEMKVGVQNAMFLTL